MEGQFCFCDTEDCNKETCDPSQCDCAYADPNSCVKPTEPTWEPSSSTTTSGGPIIKASIFLFILTTIFNMF